MTVQLALPLGGWAPDWRAQREALDRARSDPAGAIAALERLGVPEPDESVRHASALAETAGRWLDEAMRLLALSPDPASAARGLGTLFEEQAALERLTPSALGVFVSLASQSAHFSRFLAHDLDALLDLVGSGALAEARTDEELDRVARALVPPELRMDRPAGEPTDADGPNKTERAERAEQAEEILALALRRLRNTELARIFYREVQGLATVDVTGREVSGLASAALDVAYRAARLLADPPAGLGELSDGLAMSIIGLGKLGAGELNFSSDVDLLFVADEIVTRHADLARYGERVAQRTRDLIDRPLHGSRVFRVDLRLRPDGSRGPLLGYPRGLRDYYERIARTWERAALLRARVVAGDPGPGREALELLDPIRHPRTVDPSAVDDLKAMKDRIDRHESWRGRRRLAQGWDSKVGRGGIREVEFVVAMFQYLLAGREPSLRGVSTYDGLGRIAGRGMLDPGDAQDLDDAYRFYRRLEHRLQMDEDRQTQRLPADPVALQRLARRLGFADWAGLDARLERHRGRVREIFERTLSSEPSAPRRRAADEVLDALSAFMAGRAENDEVLGRLSHAGFRRPRSTLGALRVLWKQPRGPMSAQVLLSADRLPATLLDAVLAAPDPDAAMSHLTDLLTHPHGNAVVAYLRAKPAALRGVMTLLGASDFLARRLTRSPWWVDRLLGSASRVLQTPPQLREGWERSRQRAPGLEARLNLLRRFHASQIVRIAMAYLEGVIDDELAAEQLTMLAEFALGAALEEARADLVDHGPLDDFAVIGMGRLGSREMGFGSDLDLVFVYEGTAAGARRYGRLARRLIHFLNIPMPDGVLYQIDLRLRPWGNDGTVVTTLDRFADYYAHRADPWERIALVRGRPVGAPPPLAGRFAEARRRICRLDAADVDAFVGRLDEVRTRLLHEVARPRPGRYHLKYGRGGLLEIELLAQVHRLRRASRLAGDAGEPGLGLLQTLSWVSRGDWVGGGDVSDDDQGHGEALLDLHDAGELREAYAFYRRLQNIVRLTLDRSVDALDPHDPSLRRARQILGRQHAELADPDALRAEIDRHVERVGAIYRRTIRSLTGSESGTAP